MDNIKSIISNNEGQRDYNFLPPSVLPATVIKGKKGKTPITMQGIQYPMIALDKYGVTFQQPDLQQPDQQTQQASPTYNYMSGTVVELPYIPGSTKKDDEMPKAQRGGSQEQQIQQLIAMYAQMKGVSPEEIIKQLQQLPKDQQQKALQSIAQEVQQAMAQQQQQQQMGQQQEVGPEQQEAMMGQQDQENPQEQEQEMAGQGMMEEGGEPCFGCYDHYNPSPQAQNLNWYYKKQGGPFAVANTYPTDWASYSGNQYAIGGNTVLQSDPNAQTYLPYMRKGETRPNFMFAEGGDTTDQWGGQSDIDRAYQMMKKGGFAMNPKKKKGGKFNHLDEFRKYLEKGGGLKKYKYDNSQTGNEPRYYKPGVGYISPENESEYCADGKCMSLQGYYGTDRSNEEWQKYQADYANQIKSNYANWNRASGFRDGNMVQSSDAQADLIAHNDLIENNLARQLQQALASGDTKLAADLQQQLMDAQHQSDHAAGYMSGIYYNLLPRKNDPYDYFTNPQNQPSTYLNGVRTPYNAGTRGPVTTSPSAIGTALNLKQDPYYYNPNMGTEHTDFYTKDKFRARPEYNLYGKGTMEDTEMDNYSAKEPRITQNKGMSNPYTAYLTQQGSSNQAPIQAPSQPTNTSTNTGVSNPVNNNTSNNDIETIRKRLYNNGMWSERYALDPITGKPPADDDSYMSYNATENSSSGFHYDKDTPNSERKEQYNDFFSTVNTSANSGNDYTTIPHNDWNSSLKKMNKIPGDDMYNYEGFDPSRYHNQNRASRHFTRGVSSGSLRGRGWEEKRDQMRKEQMNQITGNKTGTNLNTSTTGPVSQYIGKLPSRKDLGVKFWDNANIRKIKGTPDRPVPNITWNTPGAAYIQGAMNSKLFGTSGLGLALSTLTGAINPNVPLLGTESPFKAKYRRDGSLRKVKGSTSDVTSFFNPNAGTTDNTSTSTSNTTTTPSTVNPYNTANQNYLSKQNTINQKIAGLDPTSSDYYSQVAAAQKEMDDLDTKFNTWSQGPQYRRGGGYHYLPMALMGIPPIDDSMAGSPSYQAETGNIAGFENMGAFQKLAAQNQPSGYQGSGPNTSGPGDNVKVKTTSGKWWQPNKKRVQGMTAVLGAANGALDTLAANNKQDAANTMMESQSAMNNPAFNTGKATQTQFGSPANAINSGDVFPGGPGSNIAPNLNYNQQLYNNRQFVRDGGSIHDRYEDGGQYDLTDEEIQEILAAGGSIEYI